MSKGYAITELPVYKEDYVGVIETISRRINYKGELATLATTEMNYIALVDFIVGKEARGNHYHNKKVEYIYICKGRVKVYLKNYNCDSQKVEVIEVKEGRLILIEPGISHAVEAVEDGFGIEFSPTKFDLIKDDNFKDIIVY